MTTTKIYKLTQVSILVLLVFSACSKKPAKQAEESSTNTVKTNNKVTETIIDSATSSDNNSSDGVYQRFTNALAKARKLIEEKDYKSLNTVLPKVEDGDLMLFITDPKTGICHAWDYYYCKQLIANSRPDHLSALEAGNNALKFLELSKIPVKSPDVQPTADDTNKFLQLKEECKQLSYIQIAKSSMGFNKNLSAENHLTYVINPTNNASDDILCEAVGALAELYVKQGRYEAAYDAISLVLERVVYLPKSIMLQRADSCFWLNKNQEAFADLLAVLFSDDLNRKEPWNDPVLTLFLRRITRAEDRDVAALYDALGYQMNLIYSDKNLKKSDVVDTISFYIGQRKLLCEVFPFLTKADDINSLRSEYEKDYINVQSLQKNKTNVNVKN